MAKKESDYEPQRALKFLADRLGVDLNDPRHAVANEEYGARAELKDGSLVAKVFPNDEGSVKVESTHLPGIDIKVLDQTNINNPWVRDGAVYQITTYLPGKEHNEDVPGSVYIRRDGRLIARLNCVEILDTDPERY